METPIDQQSETLTLTAVSSDAKPPGDKSKHVYLFIDTETTGLPRRWNAPASDTNNWPRLVQIAWALYDADARHMRTTSFIVKPNGFCIPRDAERVHGISTARAMTEGTPLATVLRALADVVRDAEILVAHNMQFDENVIAAEFLREGLDVPFSGKRRICTMVEAVNFCRLPGPSGYKWPSLAELYAALFGKKLPEHHEAEADVMTCSKCFFELRKRGHVDISRG